MKKILFASLIIFFSTNIIAQNLIISDDSTYSGTSNNAVFEVYSAGGNKGILIPRLTTAQRTSIATTAADDGLVVYDTDTHSFWVWDGTQWTELGDKQTLSFNNSTGELSISNGNTVTIPLNSSSGDNWGSQVVQHDNTLQGDGTSSNPLSVDGDLTDDQSLTLIGTTLYISGGNNVNLTSAINSTAWTLSGNSISSSDFLGTTNNQPLNIYTNNSLHARITQKGQIEVLNTGSSVFVGEGAGNSDDLSDNDNVFVGYQSGYSNTSGYRNSANGYQSLYNNSSGDNNTALGYKSLYHITTGEWNTAVGSMSMYNTTGDLNTSIGFQSLYTNTSGAYNTATGALALAYNTSGNANAACGYAVLYNNSTGSGNAGIGLQALQNNTSGSRNAACGYLALENNETGDYNTAIGAYAGSTSSNYTNTTGIGYGGQPNASNKIHIGNTSVTWIGGQVTWSTYSDERIKTNVKEDVKGLDFIMKLRPVTYNIDKDREDNLLSFKDSSDYKEKYDIEKIKFSGFLAQEVEKAAMESGYDFSGVTKPVGNSKLYSLSYAQFVVPLVKAVQEQQKIINQQNNKLSSQEAQIDKLRQELESLKKQNEKILDKIR